MSNAAAAIGLTYRALDLQEQPFGIFLEIVQGMNDVAEVRGVDVTVPALEGQIEASRVKHIRNIELRGYVAGQGSTNADQVADFRSMVSTLQALFDPTVMGTLEATLEDGSTATIEARTIGDGLLWTQIVPACARLSVRMESIDPEWVVSGS